ncbi:MAG: hypothetical protein B6U73_00375, partial [Desulfurococcales archaeon ex4484_204]
MVRVQMFEWPPVKRSIKLSAVIPVSNIGLVKDLRWKTITIGEFARAFAIYKINNVVLLSTGRDDEDPGDTNLFRIILEYLLVPPYLRKYVVPTLPELRYAGVLPPLNIVTHNPEGREPRKGDLREGLVMTSYGNRGKVFIGYRRRCYTVSHRELRSGDRI